MKHRVKDLLRDVTTGAFMVAIIHAIVWWGGR